jgi:hypothetical protein
MFCISLEVYLSIPSISGVNTQTQIAQTRGKVETAARKLHPSKRKG